MTRQNKRTISDGGINMLFKPKVKEVTINADSMIPDLLHRAREILDLQTPPAHVEGCKDLELINELYSAVEGK